MKQFYTYMIACCMLFVATVAYSQGTDQRQQKVPVCHKGTVIWVAAASVPAHLAHGDQLAVLNAAGQYECPCKPDGQPPVTYCPDGSLQNWYWDVTFCKWVAKDCPRCEPTQPMPDPRVCPDGTLAFWYWDYTICKWMPKDCPPCQPTSPMPDPKICADGTVVGWTWDATICKWVARDCPCNTVNNPPPPCPVPGAQCCWMLTTDCKWLLVDCATQMPIKCGTVINGIVINCNCVDANGGVRICP